MIFTNYLKAEKISGLKSKFRMEITARGGNHVKLENILLNKRNPNKGGYSLYLTERPRNFGGAFHPDLAITKGRNISSIYIPNPRRNIGYGDIYGTNDAIIFILHPDATGVIQEVEMYIAKGQRNNKKSLYQRVCNRSLDKEIKALRAMAVKLKISH